MTSLRRIQKDWDSFGKSDPLWAVITAPGATGNRWDLDEFWRTGRSEMGEVWNEIQRLGRRVAQGSALDFGCGVGRLSRVMAGYFNEVVGVDIAPSMIELANEMSAMDGRCHYVLNQSDDLAQFDDASFDFVYTNITLQHIPPRFTRRYFDEFLRVLRPGGLIVFELLLPPERPSLRARGRAARLKSAISRRPTMHAYWMSEEAVRAHFQARGARVLDVTPTHHDGFTQRARYCVAPD